MKTLVKLWIDRKVNSKIIKEVLELSVYNTPKSKEIEISRDELDDKLLIVKFESYRGKQVDLADRIIKSYSHFLECYSDISVFFETRRKKISSLKDGVITKKEVVKLAQGFMKSYDNQDWELIAEYLDEKIELIPEQRTRIRYTKTVLKSDKYVDQKKKALSSLRTKHEAKKITTSRGDDIKCQYEFEMKGVEIKSGKDFTLNGVYEFIIRMIEGKLKIKGIKLETKELQGNKKIYKIYKG